MQNKKYLIITAIVLVCILSCNVQAQVTVKDSTKNVINDTAKNIVRDTTKRPVSDTAKHTLTSQQVSKTDTSKTAHKKFTLIPKEHSPKVAGIASLIIPGLGQVYNKKYWKVPIIYVALAVTGYFIYQNYTIYHHFRASFKADSSGSVDSAKASQPFRVWAINGGTTYYPGDYGHDDKFTIQDKARTELDLSVIVATAIYALNIVDAVVDAHLYHFNINDNLSLIILPTPPIFYHNLSSAGISLKLKF